MLMAADVSSLVRMMSRYNENEKENDMGSMEERRELVTRDLLGHGGTHVGSKELDLDLLVPSGWEKRLDLVSGEVYVHRSGGAGKTTTAPDLGGLQDLNFPPPQPPSLELRLFPVSSSSSSTTTRFPPADYQSVCTLDKVKSALDRLKHRATTPSPVSSSTTTASGKRRLDEDDGDGDSRSSVEVDEPSARGAMVAAGCPSCLSYVLISEREPRCPRCGAVVVVAAPKKPRLDLNLAVAGRKEADL